MRTTNVTGGPATTSSVGRSGQIAQVPAIREFQLSGRYESSGAQILWVGNRKVGILVKLPDPDNRRVLLGRRSWNHLMHKPAKGWAVAQDLLYTLVDLRVSWIRLELHTGAKWISWETPVEWLLGEDSLPIHHPPFEPQRLLPLDQWIYVDHGTIRREMYGTRFAFGRDR